ncbi:ABC transporter permease [Paenibacillus antri]|uniref:ABC transporter permease n=1 Tax=Paenibacillus antri TaxID=2582848 RepID=A0A5R9GE47_9BACL|nr:ABC transporter permease [Paenibacillus antri]TLS51618.1 ABC transporter permease [Paenibacillus antri]
MTPFLKKDVLLILRDRKELAILILMPFVLIAILGFALGDMINATAPTLDMGVVVVDEEDEAEGLARFQEEVRSAPLPEDAKTALLAASEEVRPQRLLRDMLESEALSELLAVSEMELEAARTALERDEANAIVRIPPNFTYDTLRKMLLERGDGATLELEASESSPLRAGVIRDIVDGFVRSVNFQTALGQTSGAAPDATDAPAAATAAGGVESVSRYKTVNSLQYYTIGMAVMFVLYVASSTAGRAFLEKRQYTFDRMIIAGAHPLRFLGGKIASGAMLAFLQLAVLFLLSSLIFQSFAGQPPRFWAGLALISAAAAVCVGGLAALLTAMNYRLQTGTATDLFSGMMVSLLAFLGGSFFPTAQMSDWLNALGGWTPNGAALSSYLQMLQGADSARWMDDVYRLLGMAVVFAAAAVWMFPKRRDG